MSTLDTLRQATPALLATAPEPVVRRTLRELRAGEALDAGDHAAPRRRRRGHAVFPGKVQATKPDWSDLRRDVRTAMRERGVSFDQVATQIGFARSTVQNAISRKVPPSPSLETRLTDWLARAQEAAMAIDSIESLQDSEEASGAILEARCCWEVRVPGQDGHGARRTPGRSLPAKASAAGRGWRRAACACPADCGRGGDPFQLQV